MELKAVTIYRLNISTYKLQPRYLPPTATRPFEKAFFLLFVVPKKGEWLLAKCSAVAIKATPRDVLSLRARDRYRSAT